MRPLTLILAGQMLVVVALSFMAAHQVGAEKSYDFANVWNDANQGGFTDGAPIVFVNKVAGEESDFFFQYAQVPHRTNMHPMFCLRKGEARAVQCFYVHDDLSHGDVVVEAVIPKDLPIK